MFRLLYDSSENGISSDLLRWDTFSDPGWNEVFSKGSLAQNGALLGLRPFQNITRDQYNAMRSMRKAVTEWACKWNLNKWVKNDPWFFEQALTTLCLWHCYPATCENLEWTFVSHPIRSPEVAKTRFTLEFHSAPDLALERRSEAEGTLQKRFESF